MRDPKTGRKIGKEWRLEVTDERLARLLHNTCKCQPHELPHAVCEGFITRKTAFYTEEFARRAVHHMSHLVSTSDVQCWIQDGRTDTERSSRFETSCECRKVQLWNRELCCFRCMLGEQGNIFVGEHKDLILGDLNAEEQELVKQVSAREREKIMSHISLIHSSTGHGSYHLLVQALHKHKASPVVLALAKSYRCSACEERKRPDPRKRANLHVHTDRWRSVQVDAAFWRDPRTKKQYQFVVILDEASRFMVTALSNNMKRVILPSEYVQVFDQRWKPYFGIPDVVRSDPEGAWRAHEIVNYFNKHGIQQEVIPAEAHWNLSHVERSIGWLKELLSKLVGETDDSSVEQLLAQATYVWNQHENVRGYSPFQHALGRTPDSEGRLFDNRVHDLPMEMMQNPDDEHDSAVQLRASAAKIFIDWQLQEKLTRARNSRKYQPKVVTPGDLVFYWRTTVPANESHSWNRGVYLGPARVLAVETKKDEDHRLHPGNVVWLVRGTKLIKVALEQVRHASAREASLHELNKPLHLPWTFTGIAADLQKGEYYDHTGTGPTSAQSSSVDPQEEQTTDHPTGRRRYDTKRPAVTEMITRDSRPRLDKTLVDVDSDYTPSLPPSDIEAGETRTSPTTQATRGRSRSRQRTPMPSGTHWVDEVQSGFWQEEVCNFWNHSLNAAVEIEVELPTQHRNWKKFFKNSQAFFISALKRRSIEVSERRMSAEEHEQFSGAKQVEVDKFVAAEALQALPPHLRPNRSQALRMRWVLTWKKKDDGTLKPKARAVVLGFLDPDYANRPTFAPTMTRQSRQVLLQWAANHHALVHKGDVAAAFLQGREFERELYLIPTPEICQAMNLPTESIVKMRKACYGLVEAPIEWFETMNSYLQTQGFEQLKSDPCCWRLRDTDLQTIALVSGHVDDFMFCGLAFQTTNSGLTQKLKFKNDLPGVNGRLETSFSAVYEYMHKRTAVFI